LKNISNATRRRLDAQKLSAQRGNVAFTEMPILATGHAQDPDFGFVTRRSRETSKQTLKDFLQKNVAGNIDSYFAQQVY